jgi:hypothetical protein
MVKYQSRLDCRWQMKHFMKYKLFVLSLQNKFLLLASSTQGMKEGEKCQWEISRHLRKKIKNQLRFLSVQEAVAPVCVWQKLMWLKAAKIEGDC